MTESGLCNSLAYYQYGVGSSSVPLRYSCTMKKFPATTNIINQINVSTTCESFCIMGIILPLPLCVNDINCIRVYYKLNGNNDFLFSAHVPHCAIMASSSLKMINGENVIYFSKNLFGPNEFFFPVRQWSSYISWFVEVKFDNYFQCPYQIIVTEVYQMKMRMPINSNAVPKNNALMYKYVSADNSIDERVCGVYVSTTSRLKKITAWYKDPYNFIETITFIDSDSTLINYNNNLRYITWSIDHYNALVESLGDTLPPEIIEMIRKYCSLNALRIYFFPFGFRSTENIGAYYISNNIPKFNIETEFPDNKINITLKTLDQPTHI